MIKVGNIFKVEEDMDESVPPKNTIIKIISLSGEDILYEILNNVEFLYKKTFTNTSKFIDVLTLQLEESFIPPDKTESISTLPSKEDLLAEAKRRYPIGSIVTDAKYSGGKYEVTRISDELYNDVIGNGSQSYLYYKGKWAEIVETAGEISRDDFKQFAPGYEYSGIKVKQKKGWIDPTVQTVKPVNVQLVQTRKVTYF